MLQTLNLMFILSLVLFLLVLAVIAAAFGRGLSHMDEILHVVEPGDSDADLPLASTKG